MEEIIALQHVSRSYGTGHTCVAALDGVSLRVCRGEFLAIAGPSGSGKSTLLHLIGCIDQPTAGAIRVGGMDVHRHSAAQLAAIRRQKLGFVFQTFNLIPVFSALENVEYPLLLHRVSAAERHGRAMDALASVGLTQRAAHRPDQLSAGERQRVAVARAIVHRPMVVLADEPTANLDSHNAAQLIELMHGLNRDSGITFVFATHDGRLLGQTARVVSLRDGRVTNDASSTGDTSGQPSAPGCLVTGPQTRFEPKGGQVPSAAAPIPGDSPSSPTDRSIPTGEC